MNNIARIKADGFAEKQANEIVRNSTSIECILLSKNYDRYCEILRDFCKVVLLKYNEKGEK